MDRSVTLISGARKGIGAALVKYYVECGHIVIGFSRSAADYDYKNYYHFQGDVSDEKFIKNLITNIKKQYGKLDNLINNAGIAAMNHLILTPLDTVKNIMETNFIGTFLLCRESAKLMQSKNYGRIVNMSTVAVPMKLEGEAVYAASKSAVVTFTKILAKELASFGITVNCLAPTPVNTDLIKNISENKIKKLIDMQAIKRLGSFEDIKNVIDFFLSKKSDFITGQQIFLGGVS